MKLFPAIDLQGGRVVRLLHGDYDQMEIYGTDPAAVAEEFLKAGAKHLHLVDLDGAKEGAPKNLAAIRSVLEVKGLFVELGGGIRDEGRVEQMLSLG